MDRIFLELLNLSIAASWLILAILLLRPLLKKAPKSIVCALWLIVGLRLILPFSIESVLSLIPSRETVSPEIVYAAQPMIDSGVKIVDQVVNPVVAESLAPAPAVSVNPVQVLSYAGGCVWLMGLLLMLGYSAVSYIRLRRKVREAVLVEKDVRQGPSVESPFVLGLFRPCIYLPSTLAPEDVPMVLAHERAHIRRRDNWIKPLGFLLLSVYWFNPLLWLSYVLLCRDIEMACDERVMKELGNGIKKSYSMALLNCSYTHRAITACPLAFGEVSVKTRIKSVLNYKKPSFWITVAALLVCAVVAVCFLTDPVEEAPKDARLAGNEHVGLWVDPLKGMSLNFDQDGTVSGSDSRMDIAPTPYSAEKDKIIVDFEEPLVLQVQEYKGIKHLINEEQSLDLVGSAYTRGVEHKINLDNWQEFFELLRVPEYKTNQAGQVNELSYSLVLVPKPEYAGCFSQAGIPDAYVDISIEYEKTSTQMVQVDDNSLKMTVLGEAPLDDDYVMHHSYGKDQFRRVAQSAIFDSLYVEDQPGFVLSTEYAVSRSGDGYWVMDFLEEPKITAFEGTLILYENPIRYKENLALPGSVQFDSSIEKLFASLAKTAPTQSDGNNSLLLIIPAEGEGADYAPGSLAELSAVNHLYGDSRMADSLEQMLYDCRAAGYTINVYRAYESFGDTRYELGETPPDSMSGEDYQQWLRSPLKRELQTGLSVVLARDNRGNYTDSKADQYTQDAQQSQWADTLVWLQEHAASYGFIQRFPADKYELTGSGLDTVFRYVGGRDARYMADHQLCLEEYLYELAGQSLPEQEAGPSDEFVFLIPKEGEGEDYAPAAVTEVENRPVDARIAGSLERMLSDCRAAGHTVAIFRAYESYADAKEQLANREERWTEEEYWDLLRSATKRELQTGLSVLLATYEDGGIYRANPSTEEDQFQAELDAWHETIYWLMEHAPDYGFIQRNYKQVPGQNVFFTGVFRYVGEDMARYLTEQELGIDEYLVLAQPAEAALGKVELVSTSVNGYYYTAYVNISPVEKEDLLVIPSDTMTIRAAFSPIENSMGLATGYIMRDEYNQPLFYDEQTKTLMVSFPIFNYKEILGDAWPLEMTVKMACKGQVLPSPGSFLLPAPVEESRSIQFAEPLAYEDDWLENPIYITGLELSPGGAAWLVEWADMERYYHPGVDWSALSGTEREWISQAGSSLLSATGRTISGTVLHFRDGSQFQILDQELGAYLGNNQYAYYTDWPANAPIDIDAVTAITIGGRTISLV